MFLKDGDLRILQNLQVAFRVAWLEARKDKMPLELD
jgi:hypothetical protein